MDMKGDSMKSYCMAGVVLVCVSITLADWSDNFDSYSPGGLHASGGWEGWGGASQFDAVVTDSLSYSQQNCVGVLPSTDIVHQFNESAGAWQITGMQYIPSGGTGDQFFIMHSQYTPGGGFVCAHDLIFHQNQGTVEFAQTGSTTPIIYDQWVEISVTADLDWNTQEAFYNGESLGTAVWVSSGIVEIATIDLFSWNSTTVYYDNLEMVGTASDFQPLTWAGLKSIAY